MSSPLKFGFDWDREYFVPAPILLRRIITPLVIYVVHPFAIFIVLKKSSMSADCKAGYVCHKLLMICFDFYNGILYQFYTLAPLPFIFCTGVQSNPRPYWYEVILSFFTVAVVVPFLYLILRMHQRTLFSDSPLKVSASAQVIVMLIVTSTLYSNVYGFNKWTIDIPNKEDLLNINDLFCARNFSSLFLVLGRRVGDIGQFKNELRLLFISIVIIFSLIVQTPEIARTTVSLKLIKPDSVCCIHSQYRSRDRVWSILRVSIGFASLRIIGLPGEMAVTAFARWNSSIYVPNVVFSLIIIEFYDITAEESLLDLFSFPFFPLPFLLCNECQPRDIVSFAMRLRIMPIAISTRGRLLLNAICSVGEEMESVRSIKMSCVFVAFHESRYGKLSDSLILLQETTIINSEDRHNCRALPIVFIHVKENLLSLISRELRLSIARRQICEFTLQPTSLHRAVKADIEGEIVSQDLLLCTWTFLMNSVKLCTVDYIHFASASFPEFAALSSEDQQLMLRNFSVRLFNAEIHCDTFRRFGAQEGKFSMATITTCYDTNNFEFVSENENPTLNKLFASVHNHGVIFALAVWLIPWLTISSSLSSLNVRRRLFEALKEYYEEELHLDNYSVRLGNLIKFKHTIQANNFATCCRHATASRNMINYRKFRTFWENIDTIFRQGYWPITVFIIHPLAIVVILKKSSLTTDLKLGHVCHTILMMCFDFYNCFLYQMYTIGPLPIIICSGYLCNANTEPALLLTILSFFTVSCVVPYLFLMMRVHQRMLLSNSKLKLSGIAQTIVLFLITATLFSNVLGFHQWTVDIPNKDEMLNNINAAWIRNISSNVLVLGVKIGDAGPFSNELMLLLLSIFVVFSFYISMNYHAIHRIGRHMNIRNSKKLEARLRFVHSLTMQAAVSAIFFVSPLVALFIGFVMIRETWKLHPFVYAISRLTYFTHCLLFLILLFISCGIHGLDRTRLIYCPLALVFMHPLVIYVAMKKSTMSVDCKIGYVSHTSGQSYKTHQAQLRLVYSLLIQVSVAGIFFISPLISILLAYMHIEKVGNGRQSSERFIFPMLYSMSPLSGSQIFLIRDP
ncbi:hypothetical protein PRIPAC_82924 [Pristionchus pacificus]|uniref:G protein-coupled receptor n=1 Tax=Pristionchus pacificus TaxID=54126 RepID=A0A2A6C3Y6_PRIPA|nr:hypothetical protein PRIPAC_82924 [Pristionchus pacificus]|eukprot:PDM72731.1 G protein-coupled receptor [Pristionchus pacificus]